MRGLSFFFACPSLGEKPNRIEFCEHPYASQQDNDKEIQARFVPVAQALANNEAKIVAEMLAAQGSPMNIDGYYWSNPAKTTKTMRPSAIFNGIIDAL